MAHRRPLGTTCEAHFPIGPWCPPDVMDSPELGDYLVSEAGTAYIVVGLEEGRTRVRYVLERAAEPEPDARVFGFYWLPRKRRGSVV
jgi:hypothetical protein